MLSSEKEGGRMLEIKSLGMLFFAFLVSDTVLENFRINVNCTTYMFSTISIYLLLAIPCRLKLKNKEKVSLAFFAVLLSLANSFGSHIHIGQQPYWDLRDQSYFMNYGWIDLFKTLVLSYILYHGLKQAVYWMLSGGRFLKRKKVLRSKEICFWIPMVIFIICWFPYLILYYPGFILGDSITSIKQALGIWGLTNHHPVMYTLFVKMCITIGMHFGDLSLGIAIYSCLQMFYIAFAMSKLVEWLSRHKCPFIVECIFIIFYAVMPFFGQITVAMWKDPTFGASVVLWTLCILSFYESVKIDKRIDEKKYFVSGTLMTLLVCFLRNNGVYVLLFFMMVLCIGFLHHKNELKKSFLKVLLSAAIVVGFYYLITGPVYSHFNIAASPVVESVGVPLNQMASVVASPNGIMSEADKEFMNNLLPLELYPETYRPCVVDRLKWDANFDEEYLNNHIMDFLKTYISMGVKNPRQYIEGWAMMTFGYWAPNRWEFCNDTANLHRGNFGDLANSDLDIQQVDQYHLPDSVFYKVFPNIGTVIPLPWVHWIILFAIMFAIWVKDFKTVLAFTPSLGVVITLLIAVPYYYWPRYGMAQFYLLPLYLYLMVSCMIRYEITMYNGIVN